MTAREALMPDTLPLLSPMGPRLKRVKRIAVLRGGGVGDVLLALPALEALATAYPEASIELLGMPIHTQVFAGRPSQVSVVHELPFTPGLRSDYGGGDSGPDQIFEFFDAMRARAYDLAVQMHSGGAESNPFTRQLGALTTIGSQADNAPALDHVVPYRHHQHETMRALEVVALVGAAPVTLEPHLQRTRAEVERGGELRSRLGVPDDSPLVIIHPGARDARRRWPADNFVRVALQAIEDGAWVVVVGDESERNLADAVAGQVSVARGGGEQNRISSLAGKLNLSDLIALLGSADATVANDSGPRHLAQALGCPTVSIYLADNLLNAGPLTRTRDRVHIGWTTSCPTCSTAQIGAINERCDHNPSFVADVRVEDVYADLASLLP